MVSDSMREYIMARIDEEKTLEISDRFRRDLQKQTGCSLEQNTRDMALRVLFYLYDVRNLARHSRDMNFDVGLSSFEYFVEKAGKKVSIVDIHDKLPEIESNIKDFFEIMGYNKDDARLIDDYLGD